MAANRSRGYVLTDKGFSKLKKVLEQYTESRKEWCTYIREQLELKNKPLSSQTIRAFLNREPKDQETITHIFEALELECKFGSDYEKHVDQSKNIADKCPYRGLSTFEIEDEHFFFGREKFINDLIERVETQPLVTVIGRSGIGKSSVVKAGLIPRLKKKPGNFKMTVLRPKNRPFYEFYKAILELFEPELKDTKLIEEAKINENKFKKEDLLLNEIVEIKLKKNDSKTRFLIVIDQFEEIFTLVSSDERNIFLKQLLEVINQQRKSKPDIVIVLTLRIDFVPEVYRHLELASALRRWDPDYLVDMNREELEQVIKKPAKLLNVVISDDLAQEILNDVEKKKIELPLLELALEKLWENRNINGSLTVKTYRKIGKIKEVIKEHANSVLEYLNPNETKQAQHIFTQLVNFRDDGEPTRRLATKSGIGVKYWGLVDKLASLDNRLLVIDFDDKKDEETVEIVHESLINEWDRLKSWIKEDKKLIAWQRNLQPLIKQWQTSNKDNDDLLRGSLLHEAQKWLDEEKERLNNDYIEFILDSLKYQEQENIERIRELLDSSRKDLLLEQQLNALVLAVKAGVKLGEIKNPSEKLKRSVIEGLQQATYEISEQNQLVSHERHVNGIVFSSDGSNVFSFSDDKTIKHWNLEGKILNTFKGLEGHTEAVLVVVISHDNQTIASGSADNTVKLWNVDGTFLKTLEGHSDRVFGISFHPNGKILASGSADKTIKLWSLPDGHFLKTLKGHEDKIWKISFSPNGKVLASASSDHTIKLWNLDGKLLRTLKGHTDLVREVCFSPDGRILASGSDDETVRLWDCDGKPIIAPLEIAIKPFWGLSFSSNGQMLACVGADRTVKVCNLKGELLKTFKGHNNSICGLSFSPDSKVLATASSDKTVKLWSLIDKPSKKIEEAHTNIIRGISFSPNGQIIASASSDKTIKLWNLDGTFLRILKGHNQRVVSVNFSPNGEIIASGSDDQTVKLWNSINGKLLKTLKGHENRVYGVSFSPDGQVIASGSDDLTVKLWNVDGTFLKTLEGHKYLVYGVSFSPDGEIIASSSFDRTVKLWNRDGELLQELIGHEDWVYGASFSPDGKIIASCSEDRTVKLWSRDGTLLKTLFGHKDRVFGVSFSPDGKIIASVSGDRTVRLWHIDTEDLFMDLDSRLYNLLTEGRNWIKDYIKTNPNVRESDKQLCDTEILSVKGDRL